MTVITSLINTKAVNFLRHFRSHGYINLVAISPDQSEILGVNHDIESSAVDDFIKRYNGQYNIYFMVNEPDENAPHKKLGKHHVSMLHGVWLDADPDPLIDFNEERIRLFQFADDLIGADNPPTYIIDSGGGIQAFWLLKRPVSADQKSIATFEALSNGLAEQYSTDTVFNVDRIMRVPFTLNIPTPKKERIGREAALSTVYYAESPRGRRYDFTN